MTLTIKHATLTALCTLLFTGCFTVRDPLATTDAGVDPGGGKAGETGTAGTGDIGGGVAGVSTGSGSGYAGTTGVGYGGAGYGYCKVDIDASGAAYCIDGQDPMAKDYMGACVLFSSMNGDLVCAPASWKCDDNTKGGGFNCYDPAGGGIAGTGAGGSGEAGVKGDMGTGGSPACDCDDGNACTTDTCDANGKCSHDSVNTMTDGDKDGFSSGCDCDDGNGGVNPSVTAFSTSSFTVKDPSGTNPNMKPLQSGFTSFDYNCDGSETPRYTAVASDCELWVVGQPFCLGEGWLTGANEGVPACGSGGGYQVCQYDSAKEACLPTTLMLVQSCR